MTDQDTSLLFAFAIIAIWVISQFIIQDNKQTNYQDDAPEEKQDV